MDHTENTKEKSPDAKPRFGLLLLVCALAVAFCGFMVWFASTYLRDCCAP